MSSKQSTNVGETKTDKSCSICCEDFDKKTVWAYVDDASSSFIIDEERSPEDVLSLASVATILTLNNLNDFPTAKYLTIGLGLLSNS